MTRAWLVDRSRRLLLEVLEASNRIRLPGPSVLPVAGAVVGLYAGLAAGIFSNLIGLVNGLIFGLPKLFQDGTPRNGWQRIGDSVVSTQWHLEYAIVGVPLALSALFLARIIDPGGPRDEVKKRLRILALLVLGALAMYYPLVLLAALNSAIGGSHEIAKSLAELPLWVKLVAPALGGLLVGHLLRKHPETHGHGVPEVVVAVKRQGDVPTEGGLLKLLASSITIGSGGSAGREGPIVYGGAAFAAGVGKTLGFSRKELGILMASGAGAGIAASFNAPIAGAIFAMEIILREFELKVFSPIILASVTATMVGRGVMGGAPMLRRIGYEMVSGWEILAYAVLGLLCGLVAFAFIRFLHHAERYFSGRVGGKLSAFLGRRTLSNRAGIGGLVVGLIGAVNPAVWGTGHEFVNLAHARQLTIGFLVVACVAKLIATGITIGSGGSGGTFFPALAMGAMAGGAFGEVLHATFPTITATSGAYAMVGMGATVAGLNRGALTGMMMVYELSGNYAIILPLMVTCTIASALCHALIERRGERMLTDQDILRRTQIRSLMTRTPMVTEGMTLREVAEQLLATGEGVLPVLDANRKVTGIVEIDRLRDVWADPTLVTVLRAVDVAHPVTTLSADVDLAGALEQMDRDDVDALPVVDKERSESPFGMITRSAIRRYLYRARSQVHALGEHVVAPTELRD